MRKTIYLTIFAGWKSKKKALDGIHSSGSGFHFFLSSPSPFGSYFPNKYVANLNVAIFPSTKIKIWKFFAFASKLKKIFFLRHVFSGSTIKKIQNFTSTKYKIGGEKRNTFPIQHWDSKNVANFPNLRSSQFVFRLHENFFFFIFFNAWQMIPSVLENIESFRNFFS